MSYTPPIERPFLFGAPVFVNERSCVYEEELHELVTMSWKISIMKHGQSRLSFYEETPQHIENCPNITVAIIQHH